ncbi:LysM peptidoglycan-binding domain-containing protein [Weissella diestrammenae]|uniref:LysM peptidoglycan-binding domain-containing protein n=1 Tax=Weissella diestrammenae TaxID=1162633 RepID=A0A7G9T3U1_9LACO|nr:LysM peptidoglycan-binding domain-containing protein [Weissella diestrammenae]MCM0582753.1 LysM peptidoglycan-binding domain-containing protein [Weissella diestrammenae]QNN74766.1 LysM peptidoglycan-binding domain-containing protein [Weissella diestrammenae]
MSKFENTKLYKNGKFLVAAAALAAGAFIPANDQTQVSADETAPQSSWRAKSVDEVKQAVSQSADLTNYTVQEGDTLSSIAEATGIDLSVLEEQVSDANVLSIGQTLKLSNTQATSEAAQPTGLSADNTTYTVQSGDTLSKIAELTQVSTANIVSYNGLGSEDATIVVGQVLQLQPTQTAPAASSAAAEPVAQEDIQYNANADTDGDGFMTMDEYNAWVAKGKPEAQSVAPAATSVATATTNQNTASAPVAQATGSYSEALNAMNALRAQYGLSPVSYDAGLASTAAMRANMMAGSVDSAHFAQSYGYEVVAIQFGSGAGVISAWYNETNMMAAPGHRNWLLNASITSVGFGYNAATGTFVGEAR